MADFATRSDYMFGMNGLGVSLDEIGTQTNETYTNVVCIQDHRQLHEEEPVKRSTVFLVEHLSCDYVIIMILS